MYFLCILDTQSIKLIHNEEDVSIQLHVTTVYIKNCFLSVDILVKMAYLHLHD